MCFYDYEEPEFSGSSMPIARKEHSCCECRTVIGRGQQYECVSGKWNGDMEAFSTCQNCVELRKQVIDHEHAMGCKGADAVPPFGEVLQAIQDIEREYA